MREIHRLSRDGKTAQIAALSEKAVSDPSSPYYINSTDTKQKQTPIFFAAYNGHIETVELLLAKGANVFMTSTQGLTVLHLVIWKLTNKELFAAEKEALFSIAELLLKINPELYKAKDKDGDTPIDYAGKPEVEKRLKEIIRGLHIAEKHVIQPNIFSKIFSFFWRPTAPSYARIETRTPPPEPPR